MDKFIDKDKTIDASLTKAENETKDSIEHVLSQVIQADDSTGDKVKKTYSVLLSFNQEIFDHNYKGSSFDRPDVSETYIAPPIVSLLESKKNDYVNHSNTNLVNLNQRQRILSIAYALVPDLKMSPLDADKDVLSFIKDLSYSSADNIHDPFFIAETPNHIQEILQQRQLNADTSKNIGHPPVGKNTSLNKN